MKITTILEKIKDIATDVVNLETTNAEESTPEATQPEETVDAAPVLEEEVVVEEVVEAAPVAEEVIEEAPAPEFATKAELQEAVDNLKSLFSKQQELLKQENVELKKQLEVKPDAEPISVAPKVELSTPAADKKGRITQFLNNL